MGRIPLSIHSAAEMFAAPAIMISPFVFGFGQAATVLLVLLGAALLGLALQADSPTRTVALRAHAELDYALAVASVAGGLTVGLISGEWPAAIFLAGVGAAMAALTASTRFSSARGA